MALLPFVVQPRRKPIIEKIGSEESGIIEVERRGYLTTGEKSFVQQVQQYDDSTTEIVTLSRRVARKYSIGMDKAYELVLFIISGAKNTTSNDDKLLDEIEQEFANDLTDVVKGLAASQAREEIVLAACMLKYRLNTEFSMEDIATIHPDIIEGLAKLYRDEDRRSIEAFTAGEKEETAKPSIEEQEKKPVKATKSHSKTTTGD